MSALATIAALAACDSPLRPVPKQDRLDIRELVTGEARAALDASGRFQFQWDETIYPLMPRQRALEVAGGGVHLFVSTPPVIGIDVIRQELESAYGGPIDFRRARPDPGRVYLVHSYLAELPDTLPLHALSYWGPWYAVPIYVDGVEVTTVGVAARSSISVDAAGRLSNIAGNDFDLFAVPSGRGSSVIIPPERAVDHVARRVNRRVSRVPRLLRPANRGSPSLAAWELTFENEFTVQDRATGTPYHVATVYLTQYGGLYNPEVHQPLGAWRTFIRAPLQPQTDTIYYPSGSPGGVHFMEWPISPDHPVRFIEVELPAGSLSYCHPHGAGGGSTGRVRSNSMRKRRSVPSRRSA